MNRNFTLFVLTLVSLNCFSRQWTYESLIAYRASAFDSVRVRENKRNLNYDVRGAYKHAVKKERLEAAKKLSDVYDGYPSNWVKDYVSTEIVSMMNGSTVKATGVNDNLTSKQIDLLRSAQTGSTIDIYVNYMAVNVVTGVKQIRTLNYSAMLIPEKEAEFAGGNYQMEKYFNANVIDKISEINPRILEYGLVRFTVSEDGSIFNTRLVSKTGNSEVDKFLLEGINRMPKWIPAKNSKGEGISQDFEFGFGVGGC